MKREGRCGALLGVWCAIGLTVTVAWAQTAATQINRMNWLRSIYSSLPKVEGGVHGHEEASKRRASVQAISPVTERRYAAPPLDLTRYKVG
jgi:hypothetical protein